MKNKKIIFLILIIVICILLICFLPNKKSNKATNPEDAQKQTEEIIDVVLDPDSTIEQLSEKTKMKMNDYLVLVGDDSALRTSLPEKSITKNNLDNYVSQQNEYAQTVEDSFLKNLDYQIVKTETFDNGDVGVNIEVTGFYYQLYQDDLFELQTRIYEEAGYELDDIEENTPEAVAFYKAKVKALAIMNNFVQDYENYNETNTFQILYSNGTIKNSDEVLTLILNLKGMTYDNMDFSKDENVKMQEQRIEKYIKYGYESGLLKKGNVLDL